MHSAAGGGVTSTTEGDEGSVEDHHDKKKKLNPFQKMKNFFRGSSKKRFKVGDVQKSQSTGALHHKLEDLDSDDGGFIQKFPGHTGSRSISEDSVFKTDSKEPSAIGVLKGHAVSLEDVVTTVSRSELNARAQTLKSELDIEIGLPPSTYTIMTPHGLMFHMGKMPVPSTHVDSDEGLVNVDGSNEDVFTSAVEQTGTSDKRIAFDNLEELNAIDLDVQISSASLNNEAAKHRISIRPRKMPKKTKERSSTSSPLPDVTEEAPVKLQHTKEQNVSKGHKMIISTTIPVGDTAESTVYTMPKSGLPESTVYTTPRSKPSESAVYTMPRSGPPESSIYTMVRSGPHDIQPNLETSVLKMLSEPKDLSQNDRTFEELEKSRQGSMSPLSTSPVSIAMLHEVKLRPPSLSGKLDNVDVKKESVAENVELANAFNRARRISRKFEDGTIDINPVKVLAAKESEKEIENKTKIEITKTVQLNQEQLKSPTAYSSIDSPLPALGGAFVNGISFVVKKETLRPKNKMPETLKIELDTNSIVTKTETKETEDSKHNLCVGNDESIDEEQHKTKISVTEDTTTNVHKSTSQSSPHKLISPREGYRLRRQNRSRTLPASKEKEDEVDTMTSSGSVGAADYDNVKSTKCSSWTSSTVTTRELPGITKHSQTYMEHIVKGDLEQNKVDNKPDVENEAKIEVKSTSQTSNAEIQQKLADKTNMEQKISSDGGIHKHHSSVKSRALGGKNYEKSISPTTETSVIILGAGVIPLDKPSVQSVKSQVISTMESPSGTPISTVATVCSISNVTKSSTANSHKLPTHSNKPPVPSTKPVLSINVDKSGSQQLTKAVLDRKTPRFRAASSGCDVSSVRSPSVTNKPNTDICKPNESTVTAVQYSLRQVGIMNPSGKLSDSNKDSDKKLEENKSIDSEIKDSNPLVKCNSLDKSKTSFSASISSISTVPAWKQVLNQKKSPTHSEAPQIQIEIIDKEVTEKQLTQRKTEEKCQKVTAAMVVNENCSDTPGSKTSSKVLDMVKSFQRLQVT